MYVINTSMDAGAGWPFSISFLPESRSTVMMLSCCLISISNVYNKEKDNWNWILVSSI